MRFESPRLLDPSKSVASEPSLDPVVLRLGREERRWTRLFEVIPQPPESLWVNCLPSSLAVLERLPERGLGIVGTRAPTSRTQAQIHAWIQPLKGSELVIVSGFARGVDAGAHWAAIEAGLPTVAVLACGFEVDYPVQNRALRKRIVSEGGVLVTESEPEARPQSWDFLRRNRIIAAWSQALWVAEAGERSGALNTATWARDLHRACFATPCSPGDQALAGNQGLLDQHHALAFWGAHSLGAVWLELSALGAEKRSARRRTASRKAIGGDRRSDAAVPIDARRILDLVRERTYERGGIAISELLDEAIGRGQDPSGFFEILGETIRRGICREENGLLIAL